MPKSKKRGGEKAHRKRVQKNNIRTKKEVEKAQKMFQDTMMEQIQAMRDKLTAETENNVVTDDSTESLQPTENF